MLGRALPRGRSSAISLLRKNGNQDGVIGNKLYVAGLETAKQGTAAMRRAMANVIELEILPELNAFLPLILAIAKIATMVGLLGTVVSMIGTFAPRFRRSAESKQGNVSRPIEGDWPQRCSPRHSAS